jgi:hypothetical protein
MKVKFGRWGVSALVAVIVAIPAAAAFAVPIVPGTPRAGSLIEAGPVAVSTGFPTWYRDQNGAGVTSRLELCLPLSPGVADPLCPVPFTPNEMFYQNVVAPGVPGTGLLVDLNLEAAYSTAVVIPGNEIVFGRIRMRDKTVPDGTVWRVTQPYGIDEVTASLGKGINMTEDIGLAPGSFGAALAGRVGPFLKWDPAVAPLAPAGYIGDPNIAHTVIGSPYGTNFVKVERKNPDGTYTLLGQTDQFLVSGRYATNSGVDVPRAVYTRPATGPASIDVFASSESGQSIQVSANAALGFATTSLRSEQGRYFGRLPITVAGAPLAGATIEVVNVGDKPIAKKTVKLTDAVTITSATYTAGAAVSDPAPANTLVVTASSSDAVNPPVLTVTGFGPLVAGTASFPVISPPSVITVTSSRGGSATIAPSVAGASLSGTTPVAAFTGPVSVSLGQPVVLDAAPSTGGPLTYAWAQLLGTGASITPTPPTSLTTPTLTFTPTKQGTYVMQLIVTGPGSPGLVSLPVTRTITVTPAAPALSANAGPNQTVRRGTVVTLDASATLGAQSLAWTQLSGPAVTLSSTTAANPTFTYGLMPLPNAAVGNLNTGYVVDNAPLTFLLTATAVGGATTAVATVVITPVAESITAVTARYRTIALSWRVTGLTSLIAGQRVVVILGPLATGKTIGTATVDGVGAFSVKGGALPDPNAGPGGNMVTVVSATGGIATATLLITT